MRSKFIVPTYIKTCFKLYLTSILFLSLFRLIYCANYVVYKVDLCNEYNRILISLFIGLRFDTIVIFWILIIPIILLGTRNLCNRNNIKLEKLGFYLFVSFFLVYLFIETCNLPYYNQFGSYIKTNALMWFQNPEFLVKMVSGSFSYWGFLVLFVVLAFLYAFISKKIIYSHQKEVSKPSTNKNLTSRIAFFVICSLVSIFSIRGRISKSPMHEGMAIIGENHYINQMGLNANYVFWTSLLNKDYIDCYEPPKKLDQYFAKIQSLFGIIDKQKQSLARVDSNQKERQLNVVIIMMESMAMYKMGFYGGENLTPELNSIIQESVFCSNFFSSGIHTFNGLFSTVTGYPAIYSEASLRKYLRKPFLGIGTILNKKGYQTSFYCTHDPHIDNMSGFFKLNGIKKIVSQENFDGVYSLGALGVPDHILLDRFILDNRNSNKPFFSIIMTGSDHGPWKIPQNISYRPSSDNKEQRCTQYADWSIGEFLRKAKKQSWYENTLFVFLGDHGLSMGHTYEMPISYHHVPCIIHLPKYFKPSTIVTPTYQPDIPATIMGILQMNFHNETFGLDIFKKKHSFVYFSADDKFGCVDSNGYYYYKIIGNGCSYLRKYKNLDWTNYVTQNKETSKELENNCMAIHETAKFLIRKNYYK